MYLNAPCPLWLKILKIVYRDSTKGKKILILESYVYYSKKENQDSIRYTCKDCDESVTIENFKKNGQLGNVASNFPQYPEIKSGLYKNNNKKLPTIPKTDNDLQIYGDFLLMETGLRLLLSLSLVMN